MSNIAIYNSHFEDIVIDFISIIILKSSSIKKQFNYLIIKYQKVLLFIKNLNEF